MQTILVVSLNGNKFVNEKRLASREALLGTLSEGYNLFRIRAEALCR